MNMKVYDNLSDIIEEPVADGQLYIYVIENFPAGNIKIGKSTNVKQRFVSLSGSNGGGSKIARVAVSPVTYLYSMEKTAHIHFHSSRIAGTEWFDGEQVSFEDAVTYIDGLFDSKGYDVCNNTRREFVAKHSGTYLSKSVDDDENIVEES